MSSHDRIAEELVAGKIPFPAAAQARTQPLLRLRSLPPATRFRKSGFSPFQAGIKRAIDVSLAAALLVLLAPALGAIALIIRFDSAGPVLFRQTRLGLNGKPFDIFKFRTMHVLENGEHVRQAEPNDVRVTRAGRYLRALSFDEFPQLFNVLKGEMSLVGPRPHALAHDKDFGALIEGYALRQRVKPGITGLAQVNGFRGPTPTPESIRRRVEFDLLYVRNAHLLLDAVILLRTPLEIVRRRNAL